MIERLKPAVTMGLAASLLVGCGSSAETAPENNEVPESNPNVIVDLRSNNPEISLVEPDTPTITVDAPAITSQPGLEEIASVSVNPDLFPGASSYITRVVVESQNREIGTIIDNRDIVLDESATNPSPHQLGLLSDDPPERIPTLLSKMIRIGGHSNADFRTGTPAATYGVINAEKYPYGNTPDDPGVQVSDRVTLETSDGFLCHYSIVDLRELLDNPEFIEFLPTPDAEIPAYNQEGVYPLLLSPGVYGGKIGPYYDDFGLESFLMKAAEEIDKPMVAIMGSYAGTSGTDRELGGKQSAWLFAVGGVLDGCVQVEAYSQ